MNRNTLELDRLPDAPAASAAMLEQVENRPTLPFAEFIWGAGVECSFLPHLKVDQFQWTQHDRFWRDDLRRAKEELGLTHIR